MIHVTAKEVQTSLTNATDQSYEVQNKIFIFLQKTYEVYEYNDWNPLIFFLPERAISVADFTGRKRNH